MPFLCVVSIFDYITGPEDISRYENGLYQWSVTLKAQMWPPIEADSTGILLGLSSKVWWAILAGCIIIVLLCICAAIFYCWLLPRHRKQIRSTIDQNTSALSIVTNSEPFSECFLCSIFFFVNSPPV